MLITIDVMSLLQMYIVNLFDRCYRMDVVNYKDIVNSVDVKYIDVVNNIDVFNK